MPDPADAVSRLQEGCGRRRRWIRLADRPGKVRPSAEEGDGHLLFDTWSCSFRAAAAERARRCARGLGDSQAQRAACTPSHAAALFVLMKRRPLAQREARRATTHACCTCCTVPCTSHAPAETMNPD